MARFIFGIIFGILGSVLNFSIKKKIMSDALEMSFVKTSEITDIHHMLKAENSKVSRSYVELKGIADSVSEEITPFSQRVVAYHHSFLIQVVEEISFFTDIDKKQRRTSKKVEKIVLEKKSQSNLMLKHQITSDYILIDSEMHSKKLDCIKSLDKFEPIEKIKTYPFYDSEDFEKTSDGGRILGYRLIEYTIPLNYPLYVIGDAIIDNGNIYITEPEDKASPFVISIKSEEQLIGTKMKDASIAGFCGISLLIVGAIFFVMGCVSLVS